MKYFKTAWEIIKKLTKKPKAVFEDAQKQKSLRPTIYYYLVLIFASTIFGAIGDLTLSPRISLIIANLVGVTYSVPALTIDTAFFHIVFSTLSMLLIAGPLYALLSTLVLHIWIKIWKGKGSIKETFKLFVYSSTPAFLLSWIPFVSIFGWGYSVYLYIVGSQEIHKFSKKKAILVFLTPGILIIAFTILGVIAGISYLQEGSRG